MNILTSSQQTAKEALKWLFGAIVLFAFILVAIKAKGADSAFISAGGTNQSISVMQVSDQYLATFTPTRDLIAFTVNSKPPYLVTSSNEPVTIRTKSGWLVAWKPSTIFRTKPEGASMKDHTPGLVIPGGFDMVAVHDLTAAIIPEGDHAGEEYVHEVIEVLPDGAGYRTQGTANAKPDPWIVTRTLHVGRQIKPSSIPASEVWPVK